eukprot:CFRG8537T1
MLKTHTLVLIDDCVFEDNGQFIADTENILGIGALYHSRIGLSSGMNTTAEIVPVQEVVNSVFRNNTGSWGGGMYFKAETWVLRNVSVIGNIAEYGGGLVSEGPLHVVDSFFTNNQATNIVGQAIKYSEGGAIYSYKNITCVNTYFLENYGSMAGAVSLQAGRSLLLNCTFENNMANEYGAGALNLFQGSAEIRDCRFIGNVAMHVGGAIQQQYGKPSLIENSTFSNNDAFFRGGALNMNTDLEIRTSTFSNNNCFGGGQLRNNSARICFGGAIYGGAGLNMTNSGIINNTSVGWGGGIYAENTIRIDNTLLESNKAYHAGGAYASVVYSFNCTFVTNVAFEDGGALYITSPYSGTSSIATGNTFFGNSAHRGNGGAILTLSSLEVYGTSAIPSINLENDVIFIENMASSGGAISANQLNVHNCSFLSNTASQDGGAMNILQSVSSSIITNSSIVGNWAGRYGGGLYTSGLLYMSNGVVAGNTANINGGGIFAMSLIQMSSMVISCNLATFGGALYISSIENAVGVTTSSLTTTTKGYKVIGNTTVNTEESFVLGTTNNNDEDEILRVYLWSSNHFINNEAMEDCSQLYTEDGITCINSYIPYDRCSCKDVPYSVTQLQLQQLGKTADSGCVKNSTCGKNQFLYLYQCTDCTTCGDSGSVLTACTAFVDTVCQCPEGKTGNDCNMDCQMDKNCIEKADENWCSFHANGESVSPCKVCMDGYYVTNEGKCIECSTCGAQTLDTLEAGINVELCSSKGNAACTEQVHNLNSFGQQENSGLASVSLAGSVVSACNATHDAVCKCTDGYTGQTCETRCTYPRGAASLVDSYRSADGIVRCVWNRNDTQFGVSAGTCFKGFYSKSTVITGNWTYFVCTPWTLCLPGYIMEVFPTQTRDRVCAIQSNITLIFIEGYSVLNASTIETWSTTIFGASPTSYIKVTRWPYVEMSKELHPRPSRRGLNQTVAVPDTTVNRKQYLILPQSGARFILRYLQVASDDYIKYGIQSMIIDGHTYIIDTSDGDGKLSAGAIVGVCLALVTILLCFFAVLVLLHRRNQSREEGLENKMRAITKQLFKFKGSMDNEEMLRDMQQMSTPIDRDSFTILERIGAGNFGKVNKGVIFFGNQSTVCAIKVLRVRNVGMHEEEFQKEAVMLRKITHQNIVRAFGLCNDSGELFLLLEYCDLGDAKSHMESLKKPIPLRVKIIIMEQVAFGLGYLHSQNIIHRDVAARNILLQSPPAHNSAPRAKISDLGLARMTGDNNQYIKTSESSALPVRWIAPESITSFVADQSTDVWSYGITLWEILTDGTVPYPGLSNQEVLLYLRAPGADLSKLFYKPMVSLESLDQLFFTCTNVEPKKRPTFDELYFDMNNIHESLGAFNVDEKNELNFYSRDIQSRFSWMFDDQVMFDESSRKSHKVDGEMLDRAYTKLAVTPIPVSDRNKASLSNSCSRLSGQRLFNVMI